jgi:hypothetical protein
MPSNGQDALTTASRHHFSTPPLITVRTMETDDACV